MLACGLADGRVRLVRREGGAAGVSAVESADGGGAVTCVALSPADHALITCGSDGTLRAFSYGAAASAFAPATPQYELGLENRAGA